MGSYNACDLTMNTFRNFLVLKKWGINLTTWHDVPRLNLRSFTTLVKLTPLFGTIVKLNNQQLIVLLLSFCYFVEESLSFQQGNFTDSAQKAVAIR